MGGQSSKAKSKIVTDIIVDVVSKDLLNCSEMIRQQQGLDISGSGNVFDGVSMKQAFVIKTNCSQSINRDTEIQNIIAQKIQQSAEAQGEVIVSALGREKASVVSEIANKISNSINRQTIMNCASSINNSQIISVSGNNNIVRNVTMEQHGEMVRGCVQKLAEQTRLVNDLNVEQAQAASAEEKGLFGWMSSGYGMVVLVVLVVAAAIVGYFYINNSPSGQARKLRQDIVDRRLQQTAYMPPVVNQQPPPVVNQPPSTYSYYQPTTPSAPPVDPVTGQEIIMYPKLNKYGQNY
jgi:hypothetical protein